MTTADAPRSFALRHGVEELEYAIAHDLRSPLRAVSATASVLLEELGDGLSADHRALLKRQAFNAQRFAKLIDDVLDLTCLAKRYGVRVKAQAGLVADADPVLTATLLGCLLGNALKFSTGTVRVRQVGDVFSISDDGAGFEARDASRLFRPFERLVGEDIPGTGVGLAKVARIVERPGGRVWIESVPNLGTTVSFTLRALATEEVRLAA